MAVDQVITFTAFLAEYHTACANSHSLVHLKVNFTREFTQSIWDGGDEQGEMQYSKGQKERREDELWKCSGETTSAGAERTQRKRTERQREQIGE